MVRHTAIIHYLAGENRPAWYARHASVLPGNGVQSLRSPMTARSLLYHPLLPRVGVAALVLVPCCALARPFTGAATTEQCLATLVLVLVMGSVQTLVDRSIAARTGPVVLAGHAIAEGCEALAGSADPVATLLPDAATGKAFADTVRRALPHLCDPTKLSRSPLLQLSLITVALQEEGLEDTRLQRVTVLRPC